MEVLKPFRGIPDALPAAWVTPLALGAIFVGFRTLAPDMPSLLLVMLFFMYGSPHREALRRGGALRVLRTLPFSAKEIGRGIWFVSVGIPVPLICLAVVVPEQILFRAAPQATGGVLKCLVIGSALALMGGATFIGAILDAHNRSRDGNRRFTMFSYEFAAFLCTFIFFPLASSPRKYPLLNISLPLCAAAAMLLSYVLSPLYMQYRSGAPKFKAAPTRRRAGRSWQVVGPIDDILNTPLGGAFALGVLAMVGFAVAGGIGLVFAKGRWNPLSLICMPPVSGILGSLLLCMTMICFMPVLRILASLPLSRRRLSAWVAAIPVALTLPTLALACVSWACGWGGDISLGEILAAYLLILGAMLLISAIALDWGALAALAAWIILVLCLLPHDSSSGYLGRYPSGPGAFLFALWMVVVGIYWIDRRLRISGEPFRREFRAALKIDGAE